MSNELLRSIEMPNGAYLEVSFEPDSKYGDPFLSIKTYGEPADPDVGYEDEPTEAFNLYIAKDGTVTRKPWGE